MKIEHVFIHIHVMYYVMWAFLPLIEEDRKCGARKIMTCKTWTGDIVVYEVHVLAPWPLWRLKRIFSYEKRNIREIQVCYSPCSMGWVDFSWSLLEHAGARQNDSHTVFRLKVNNCVTNWFSQKTPKQAHTRTSTSISISLKNPI